MNTKTLTLDQIRGFMDAPDRVEIGHVTLGAGAATLPAAADGAPVSVPAEVALEAIQRYQGECWVDESGHLVGWPEDDSGPEPRHIGHLIPAHWGDHPITAGTVAVLSAYARQGVSHATLDALAAGIEVAVDEAQWAADPLWQAVRTDYYTGTVDEEGLLLAGASGDAVAARVAASAVRAEALRTAELYGQPGAGLHVLTPEDLVVAGCLAHMLLSRHADWSRSRVIWAVRGWAALQARYYAHGRYDA